VVRFLSPKIGLDLARCTIAIWFAADDLLLQADIRESFALLEACQSKSLEVSLPVVGANIR
jgi:hypothetical protein